MIRRWLDSFPYVLIYVLGDIIDEMVTFTPRPDYDVIFLSLTTILTFVACECLFLQVLVRDRTNDWGGQSECFNRLIILCSF